LAQKQERCGGLTRFHDFLQVLLDTPDMCSQVKQFEVKSILRKTPVSDDAITSEK